jgi:hypothetical protein
MKKDYLLNQLKAGNYRIEMQEDCGCNIYWQINNDELIPDISSDCCWVGNVLYVENPEGKEEIIAEQIAFEPFRVIGAEMTTDELRTMLKENDLGYIFFHMQFNENEAENESHEDKLYRSLVEFLQENEYLTAIRYPRNFANEYDCILIEPGADIDYDDAETVTPEKWARMYLRKDDALTKMYIGFELIER